MNIEKKITEIEKRNKRVELNKEWENKKWSFTKFVRLFYLWKIWKN